MSNLFRSQSQQQQEPQQQSNNGSNMFNRKNTVTTTTTKKTPAAAIYMHNEANFPEFISTKKEAVTDTKPNSETTTMSMYANVVSAVINPTVSNDTTTVPAGWTQITLDKKTCKMEVIDTTDFKKQTPPENTTNKIIKELDYRWYKYKVEYDLIHGENAFYEAHYSVPVYPYLDAELDPDSELSDYSNEYDTDL